MCRRFVKDESPCFLNTSRPLRHQRLLVLSHRMRKKLQNQFEGEPQSDFFKSRLKQRRFLFYIDSNL